MKLHLTSNCIVIKIAENSSLFFTCKNIFDAKTKPFFLH